MRLIDADALYDHMDDLPRWRDEYGNPVLDPDDVLNSILNAPAVAAIPAPVKCGECKFFHLHPNDDFADNAGICSENSHYCDFDKCAADRFITDSCSYGERKDGAK